jgi:hypothetical protein
MSLISAGSISLDSTFKVDSGMGLFLLYRPARLMAIGWQAGTTNTLPESTIYPGQGLRIWLLDWLFTCEFLTKKMHNLNELETFVCRKSVTE